LQLRDLNPGEVVLKEGEWLKFVGSSSVTKEHIKAIATVSKRIWAASLTVSDPAATKLSLLAECRWLELSLLPEATGSGLESLAKCQHLESVDIRLGVGQEEASLKQIAVVGTLKNLSLRLHKKAPESVLEHIAGHKALNSLALYNWDGFSDNGMAKVARIPNLTAINIDQCTKVTSVGIAALNGLPLNRLSVRGCDRLGNEGMNHIASFEKLKELLVQAIGITDVGARELTKLAQLEFLDLSDNFGITDACLPVLKSLKKLKNLNLSGTEISDASVNSLKEIQTLEVLNVASTRLSAKGIEALKKALPKTKINEAE
jgi:hypothetical protein